MTKIKYSITLFKYEQNFLQPAPMEKKNRRQVAFSYNVVLSFTYLSISPEPDDSNKKQNSYIFFFYPFHLTPSPPFFSELLGEIRCKHTKMVACIQMKHAWGVRSAPWRIQCMQMQTEVLWSSVPKQNKISRNCTAKKVKWKLRKTGCRETLQRNSADWLKRNSSIMSECPFWIPRKATHDPEHWGERTPAVSEHRCRLDCSHKARL